MFSFTRIFLLGAVMLSVAFAQDPQKARKIGVVEVKGDQAIGVKITASSADMQQLATLAFSSHGRYKVVGSGEIFDIKFTAVSTNQVKVDVTRGSAKTPVLSQTVAGSTARHALLRAADVAVEGTNGLGLKGYFTARLAFILQRSGSKGDVATSDLFLGEAKQLTHDNALTLTPRWSPDGSRVIYTSYFRTGAPDIYVLDSATGRKETFASFRGTNMGARFSPNGQRVAMVLSGEGSPEIYVANAQGQKSVKPITRTGQSGGTKSSPVWSPDGGRIVFAMEPGPQLYSIPAGGGAPQRLATGFSYTAEPDWNPANPNKLACTVRAGGSYQIAVYDFKAGSAKVVSKASFDGIEPSWLADGRHLVYTARDRSTSVLCILDTETGKSTPLKIGTPAVQAHVWTPTR